MSFSAMLRSMSTLYWHSTIATSAPLWALLELSGLTNSQRSSFMAIKSGITYLNGNRVMAPKTPVKIGSTHTLTLNDGTNTPKSVTFLLANRKPMRAPRPNTPLETFRRP